MSLAETSSVEFPDTSLVLYRGVNLAGAEGGTKVPGVANTDYRFPTKSEFDYFVDKGFNTIRLPLRWERAQPTLGAPLDPAYMASVDALVAHAAARGAYIILDLHNYGRYKIWDGVGDPRQSASYTVYIVEETNPAIVSASHFANFWWQMAMRYAGQSHIIFDLMNEPNGQNYPTYVSVINGALEAIRTAGFTNPIMVEAGGFSGAHSWTLGTFAASDYMLDIIDPGGKLIMSSHQYLDANHSGTTDTCTVGGGSSRLVAFTEWARANGQKAILGEFNGGRNEQCYTEIEALLDYMDDNRDVWIGWTAWAGGPFWPESYMFDLEPTAAAPDTERPQLSIMRGHLDHPGTNKAPKEIRITNATVSGYDPAGTVVGALSVIDPNPEDTHTFSLVDDAGGMFEIVDDALRVTGTHQAGAYNATIRADDLHGLSVTQTLMITVIGVPDWVRLQADGTPVPLDMDFQNGRWWFNGRSYESEQALYAAAGGNTAAKVFGPAAGLPFAGFNQAEFSAVFEGVHTTGVASTTLLRVDDGTSRNRVTLGLTSTNRLDTIVEAAAVVQANIQTSSPFASGVPFKHAARFKTNDFRACHNGALLAADKIGTLPPVTTMRVGRGLSGSYWGGTYRRITLYAEAASDSVLQSLTS